MNVVTKQFTEDDAVDIDTQIILRLPAETSRVLKALMHAGVSLKDRISLDIYKDQRHAVFQLDNWVYCGKIYDLPTITESLKTVDGKSFFKTADISQLCICKGEDFSSSDEEPGVRRIGLQKPVSKKYQWAHGLTPPLKNVRKHRFRKTLPKEYVELSEIEKEVKTLLRADNDAVSVKWTIIYENDPVKSKTAQPKEAEEIDIFGASISDLENESDQYLEETISTVKHGRKHESSSSEDKVYGKVEENAERFSDVRTAAIESSNESADTKSDDSNEDYEELYNIVQQEIIDLEAKRIKLQRKIVGIENITLKERMTNILQNFDREIVNKRGTFNTLKKCMD